jgi:Tir chaperone protein (CesT) family
MHKEVIHKEDLPAAHEQAVDRTLSELAEALSVDAKALKASRHLIVRNIDVGVIDYGADDWGRITLFFDLGAIPSIRQKDAYRKLLELNLILPRSHGTFCLIPGNGHVALAYQFDLFDEAVTGLSLARVIGDVLDQHTSNETARLKVLQREIHARRGRLL